MILLIINKGTLWKGKYEKKIVVCAAGLSDVLIFCKMGAKQKLIQS